LGERKTEPVAFSRKEEFQTASPNPHPHQSDSPLHDKGGNQAATEGGKVAVFRRGGLRRGEKEQREGGEKLWQSGRQISSQNYKLKQQGKEKREVCV